MEQMFRGTVAHATVYPREIARRALELHASAVVLAHNHPSGVAEPSRADEMLTQQIRASLQLLDVRVVDHLVVAGATVLSFSERGML
jgi:DNA repair protein RadC